MSEPKKLKCPNCGQTDQGFMEFVGLCPVTNDGKLAGRPNEHKLFGVKGLLCLNKTEQCNMFMPESCFEVDPTTGECVGSMPGDLF